MLDISRRHLLARLGFGAGLGLAIAGGPRSLIRELLFEPDAQTVEPHTIPPDRFSRQGQAVVALVEGADPLAMLEEGFRLLGGIGRLECAGKHVCIKPNLLSDRPPPTTTSPAVVEALVRLVKAAGARAVTLADSSGMIRFPTRDNFVATGMKAVADRTGATVLALEEEKWVAVQPPDATVMQRYLVSKPVYDAELVINVPVVKTHRFAEFSCALKNLVGIVHPRHRPSLAFLSGRWHERIAELNLSIHPALHVADATTIMIDGGPSSGKAAKANLILLSGDRVALDAVALALLRSYGAWAKDLKLRVWDQRQIKRAGELRLGTRGPEHMSVVGRSLELGQSDRFDRLLDTLRAEIGRRPD